MMFTIPLNFIFGAERYIINYIYEAEKKYDVYHTTEVHLRDTMVTYQNKLMKRQKNMMFTKQQEFIFGSERSHIKSNL